MFLIMMSIYLSTMFMILKHPISLGVCLLIQSMLISLITGMMNINFWYSYIMFLIMIGGMLVIFIYMTSVASNEKFKMSLMPLFMIIPLMALKQMNIMSSNQLEMINNLTNKEIFWLNQLMKYFIYPQSSIMIFLITYLFIMLIATVKITKIKYGPLRMMF
uniref:NADH-ubiquinone oxidoreductase chain 6 n=1 Tax=Agrilinae sp. 5 ACP-2013 TaxID=1434408 RepID=A0A3G3FXA4_9COLE|nr:NADH dehydrogenase subunit 6 [Agrilinae sp. 5 ACP-2013]